MKKLSSFAGALTMLAAVVPAGFAPLSAATVAQPPVWAVDMAASHLRFQSSVGGAPFTGMFARWHADIRFDPGNLPGSSVLVRVDMASARTGSSDRDEALPGEDWFAARKFAQVSFASRTFKDLGAGHYQAVGTLTMRGVTRPLVLPFTLRIQGNQARMTGTATIDRHVFGVGQGQFATADTVPFNVQLAIDIAARHG
ncbi:YceI family protein [Sphingomonas bacterium]|uniref:YceI family protein n=1 Tax=Sphingomonas bacterium TaxID=1895847 RepID=UPI0015768F95|nr:YceI family protein [Sphingomonas bacterium]